MNQTDLRCENCGQPLALADKACGACGHPVPAGKRAALLGARAEGFAAAGQYAEAARAAEALLALELPAEQAKLWWRKRGGWLQRAGQPRLLDAAEAALAESLRLDDGDDLSHQLWMDLLQKRGSLDKARAWYQQRLELNPEDAMAKRQQAVLRLSADFKVAAPPKMASADHREGLLIRWLKPTPYKMVVAASGLVFALGGLIAGFSGGEQLPAGAEAYGSMMKLATDPSLNIAQIVGYGAYLFWGWKSRRG